jgi:diaminopimelate decarboxylase
MNAPRHARNPYFDVAGDELLIGGKPITQLAREVGRTPFYAYDRRVLDLRVGELRSILPPRLQLHFAMKANPMPALVSYMIARVDGIDVASGGELAIALACGADPESVSFAGPGKSESELVQAVESGILINVESFREIRLLHGIAQSSGRKPRVAVRVNPDFELKSSGMKMGGGPKQFGIDAEDVPRALAEIGRSDLTFEGFHIFCGSQNLRADAIAEAHTKTLALATRLSASAPAPVRTLNIGGGFGIPYFPGETPIDQLAIGTHLRQLSEHAAEAFPVAMLVLELGRYLVGEAGVYVCRVVDRKISRGQVFLVTDGGLHHHLAASGNFGQVIRKNYPVVIANRLVSQRCEIASVVGPLCTPLDVLAERVDLSEAHEGDFVAVFQSGAYGLSASPTAFLSHAPPAEILV